MEEKPGRPTAWMGSSGILSPKGGFYHKSPGWFFRWFFFLLSSNLKDSAQSIKKISDKILRAIDKLSPPEKREFLIHAFKGEKLPVRILTHGDLLAGCGKTPIIRHSRESGSPESLEKTGFLLPQE